MRATTQKAITLTVWLSAIVWFYSQWADAQLHAVAGFMAITFGYGLPLGGQFLALRWINRHEPVGPPGARVKLRAWLLEVWEDALLFYWRQPFRSRLWPDNMPSQRERGAQRGIVFIHGFICNRGFWNPWLKQLKQRNLAYIALDLKPVFGPIDGYVPQLEEAVVRMTEATGMAPIVVCHSMGGLVARAWMKGGGAGERVDHVYTIGTPHHGTWLGRFSLVLNGWQMREGSPWLQSLEANEGMLNRAKVTCFYSNCDNIVAPVLSATLDGAINLHVPGVGHVVLAYEARVMQEVFNRLEA